MKPRVRRWVRTVAVVLVLLIVTRLTSGWTLPWLGNWLNVGQPPRASDFVMVLHGDPDTRPFVAASLVNAGLAEKVLLAKTVSDDSGSAWPLTHEIAVKVLRARSVPEDRIVILDAECRNTFDEISALAEHLEQYPGATVTVVTSNFHTRRTRWTVRRLLGPRARDARFVSAPVDYVDPDSWWKSEQGFVWFIQEYIKLAYYWLRYGSGLVWCATLAVLLVIAWCVWRLSTGRRRAQLADDAPP